MRYKSEEARERVRASSSRTHKGKVVSEETRRKQAAAKKGKHLSEEHKKRLSDALIGRSFPKPKDPKKLWGSFDELYEIWLQINQPRWKKFRNFVVELGYPDKSYHAMIKHFEARYYDENPNRRKPETVENSLEAFGLL